MRSAFQPSQSMQMKQDKEAQKTYTGLVMIGAVAVLWIGVVLLMAEVHKNARPVFIVLGGVITVGLGYAWYDFNWKREQEKTGLNESAFAALAEYDKQKEERQRLLSGDRRQPIQTSNLTVPGVAGKWMKMPNGEYVRTD